MKTAAGLAVWIAACLAIGFIGSQFPPGQWFQELVKPSWNPPSSVFAPVWTTLYILMGISAWLVWKDRGFSGAGLQLSVFALQLIVNGLWSYLFFGLHSPMAAFVDIVVLWLLIITVVVLFWKVSPLAGVLLLPYFGWVSFAAVLNFTLWQLNP